jgi:hypothetical protein
MMGGVVIQSQFNDMGFTGVFLTSDTLWSFLKNSCKITYGRNKTFRRTRKLMSAQNVM